MVSTACQPNAGSMRPPSRPSLPSCRRERRGALACRTAVVTARCGICRALPLRPAARLAPPVICSFHRDRAVIRGAFGGSRIPRIQPEPGFLPNVRWCTCMPCDHHLVGRSAHPPGPTLAYPQTGIQRAASLTRLGRGLILPLGELHASRRLPAGHVHAAGGAVTGRSSRSATRCAPAPNRPMRAKSGQPRLRPEQRTMHQGPGWPGAG